LASRTRNQIGSTITAPSRKYCQSQRTASKPIFHKYQTSRRAESIMFQGSSPMAARITPTRIDSRISRPMTASGGPPKKR
jgi:hypothetical protein